MKSDRTSFSESGQHRTVKLVDDARNGRGNGSGIMVRALLAIALLLGVAISLALPAPAPRGGNLTFIRAGAPAP
jgi:hypothetical protein